MRTVKLLYIVLVLSFASEAESKVWILKLFQKAINGIRGMKEGSAAASAVAVAAVGGGAVADTIINLNAEENTPIAGAQKTLSDDVLEPSIVNTTSLANGTNPSIGENEVLRGNDSSHNAVMTASNSQRVNSRTKTKPLVKTKLVEIEVPCNSKVGTGNRANPVSDTITGETVGRHSHKWFEKFYGQNANKRVCKTYVEVPILESNTSQENVSNVSEMTQTINEQNSEIENRNINADVPKSYDDIYIRPIMKFNQGVANSYDTVYIRPILRFNQGAAQLSQPNIDPETPKFEVNKFEVNNTMNTSNANINDGVRTQQIEHAQTVTQAVQPQTVTQAVQPQTVTPTVQPQTATQVIQQQPQKQRAAKRRKYSNGIFSFLIKSTLS